jgi:hypothetical protein
MVERYHKGPNWRVDEAESDRRAGRILMLLVSMCLILMALCIATLAKRGELYGQGSAVAQ